MRRGRRVCFEVEAMTGCVCVLSQCGEALVKQLVLKQMTVYCGGIGWPILCAHWLGGGCDGGSLDQPDSLSLL